MTRWGMVVDLGRCVGCQTCTIACKMENGLPPGTLWRTVHDVESGTYPRVRRTFVPLTCMHCADPPCHDACPTTATRVREDGIVWIRDDICIGCGSCVVACPYQARHLVPRERYYFGAPTAPELATYDAGRVGICTKCHFCHHIFDELPEGAVPGVHPEYTPACASSCIAEAILFGDLDDPAGRVARLVDAQEAPVRMLEQLGTDPSVYYLNVPELDRQPPILQHSWHGLAVSNFFCGSTGVGLYLFAVLHGWLQQIPAPLLDWSVEFGPASLRSGHPAMLLGPLLVIAGLLSVAVEAGRPLRGFNVLRNLRRSWMSRESGFALVFIVLGLLDTLFWQSPAVQVPAALAGIGVVFSQGMVLAGAKGVPAWNVPVMPAWFCSSALTAGCGAFLLLSGGSAPPWLLWAGLLAVLLDLGVWYLYLASHSPTATFQRSLAVLDSRFYWAWIVVLGHGIPAALLLAALAVSSLSDAAPLLAGAGMLAGGLAAKYVLIVKAAFLVDLYDRFGKAPAAASTLRSTPHQ